MKQLNATLTQIRLDDVNNSFYLCNYPFVDNVLQIGTTTLRDFQFLSSTFKNSMKRNVCYY